MYDSSNTLCPRPFRRCSAFRAAKCMVGVIALAGCGTVSPFGGGCGGNGGGGGGTGTISDGTMSGVNGYDVQASINVEPNNGDYGTPVRIDITFSRGASDVASVEFEDHAGANCAWANTWRGVIDKTSATRWQMPVGRLVLTGLNGVERFIALNSSGQRIAIGDIRVNGGCDLNARAAVPDNPDESQRGVFMRAEEADAPAP